MKIENNIIKHYLKNVRFITGTAYAGKSTMVAMLAKQYNMVHCGENYHMKYIKDIFTPEIQPNSCYFQTMKDWQEFLNRTPTEYDTWIIEGAKEAAELEIAELIRLSKDRLVIVDTNIPLDILKEVTDYHQVAVMLSPQTMSVENFFDREDEDKLFLKEQIQKSADPQKTMENFKACIAMVNNKEHYNEYANSGFFTLVRKDTIRDTRLETMELLAEHFLLTN